MANPIYNGKIVFQSAASLSITAAEFYYLYTTMGNSSGQWTTLMKGIAANHPVLPSTAGAAESAVLNGQAKIGIDTLDSYVTALKGDPDGAAQDSRPRAAGLHPGRGGDNGERAASSHGEARRGVVDLLPRHRLATYANQPPSIPDRDRHAPAVSTSRQTTSS